MENHYTVLGRTTHKIHETIRSLGSRFGKVAILSTILTLFTIFTYSNAKAQCNQTLYLYDSYGDGWNGGNINVYVGGAYVGNYTIGSGSSATYTFSATNGQAISISYSAGGWAYENYYTVVAGNGSALVSNWYPSSSGTWNGTAACSAPCSAPSSPGFGNNVWNVLCYDDNNFTTFKGYYTENNVNFNSAARWGTGDTPSNANGASGSAYIGCPIGIDNHSVSYKRQGFPAGTYSININRDDDYILLVDGTQVNSGGCCGWTNNTWTGNLGSTSTVELKMREYGGGSQIQADFVAPSYCTPYTNSPYYMGISQVVFNTINNTSGNTNYTYQNFTNLTTNIEAGSTTNLFIAGWGYEQYATVWVDLNNNYTFEAGERLATGVYMGYNCNVGITIPNGTSVGNHRMRISTQYYWDGIQYEPCATTNYGETEDYTINVTTPCVPPATAGFGTNTWNVLGYEHGGYNYGNIGSLAGNTFKGYYTDATVDINSQARWNSDNSPSSATGWVGCPVTNDLHTTVYKRQGFPTAFYQIDLNTHDDGVQCYVNGNLVYQIDGCCTDRGVIWSGVLCSTSTVEFRVMEGGGGSNLAVDFIESAFTAGTISGTQTICPSGTSALTTSGNTGGTWTSSNAAVATVNSAGLVSAIGSGSATITYTVNGGTCGNVQATYAVTVVAGASAGLLSGTQTACVGATTTFTSNGTAGGTWSSDNSGIASVNASSGVITGVGAGSATITYTVLGSGGCPNATATRTVSISVSPTANAGSDVAICAGQSTVIGITPQSSSTSPVSSSAAGYDNSNFTTSVTVSGAPSGLSITSINFTPSLSYNGNACSYYNSWYVLQYWNGSTWVNLPCGSSVTINDFNGTIVNGLVFTIRVIDLDNYADYVAISINNLVVNYPNSTTYNWSPTTNLSSAIISTPICSATTPTTYTLTSTSNGCSSSDQVLVSMRTIPGAPTFSANPTTICAGNTTQLAVAGLAPSGQSFQGNGSNSYMKVYQDIPEYNFTTELWMKTAALNTGIFGVYEDGGGHDRHLYLNNGQLWARVWQGNGWNTGVTLNDGQWHHIALTVQTGVGQKVYVDGNLVATYGYDHSDFNWQTCFHIGYSNDMGNFNGLIDNVRIWNTVRTQAELSANMYLNAPNGAGLVANYLMEGNANATTAGNNGNAYNNNWVDANFLTYTWAGSNAPTASLNQTQTSNPLYTTGNYTVSASGGGCLGASSTPITVTVNPILTASISIAASATTICDGTSVSFTATPTNGGAAPAYQWKVNGTNVGTNASTFTTSSLTNGNAVTCVMTSNATPCLSGSPATSNSITMVVSAAFVPTFTATPTTPNCVGTQVTYTATAGQTSYAWTFPGTAGVDYTLLSGGTSASNTAVVVYNTGGSKTIAMNYASPSGCASSGSINNTITLGAGTLATSAVNGDVIWRGLTSVDWQTASNWYYYDGTTYTVAGSTPTSATRTIIPNNSCVTQQPSVAAGTTVNAKDVVIETGATLIMTTGTLNVNGNFTNNGTFVAGTGKVAFNAAGTISGNATTFNNVDLNNGVNFGSSLSTINGIMTMNNGSWVNTNAPIYGTSSLLKYNTGGTYGRNLEWSASSGAGYPNDVQVSNNTTINYPNTGGAFSTNLGVRRDLTIDAGSNLYMDYGTWNASSSLTVGRDVTSAGDLALGNENGGDIYVGGNWTRTTGNFYANNRAVFFNGATGNQTITKTGGETFPYIVVDKAAGNVILANNVTTIGGLTLTSGLVEVGTNNLVMGGSTLSGGSATSYVKTASTGILSRNVAGTATTFPIGNGSYNPAILTNSGTADVFSLRLIDNVTANGTGVGATTTEAVVNRTWMIDEATLGGSNVTLRLQWNGAGEQINTFSPASAFIAHYIAGASMWDNIGGTVGADYVESTGITSFSPFTISSSPTFAPLPVELLSLDAQCAGENVIVSWKTASEHNSLNFIVERSEDGTAWSEIQTLAAAGNSNTIIDYAIEDAGAARGVKYYRLIQVDQDGVQKIYGPVLSNCGSDDNLFMSFPNPSDAEITLVFTDKNINGSTTLTVRDAHGRVVRSIALEIQSGTTSILIPDMELEPAVYYLQLVGDNFTSPVIKHSLR